MHLLGYVGVSFVLVLFIAWTLCLAAKRGDRTFDHDFDPPAPANDHRALSEARSRRAVPRGLQ